MKLYNIKEVGEFMKVIDKCVGDVWVESVDGDRFNMKSSLSQYIAVGRMIESRGEDLYLYCNLPEDEQRFLAFFAMFPETA